MSSIAARAGGAGAAMVHLLSPLVASAQEARAAITAEEVLETAREVYSLPGQTVSICPEEAVAKAATGEEGNVIVVCRRLGGPYEFQTREGPRADTARTAGGAPRAPDFDESCLHTRGRANCIMLGNVPPPALMVDVTNFPEALSPEDAARVLHAPDDPAAAAPPSTGERVPIALEGEKR